MYSIKLLYQCTKPCTTLCTALCTTQVWQIIVLKLPLNTAKYRDFNNVPKLRREQLKRNYKPNPRYIKRIAAKASIPLEIQKTNDDMIVEARLKYIEENEVSQLEF